MTNILIIDDDSQIRLSFEKLLKEEGYNIKTAHSGAIGLKILNETPIDLVILDMRLPDMNGFDVFKRINELDPRLPVIIMTAYGTTETAIEATKMGAYDYILKPFEIPDMLHLIKNAIKTRKFMKSKVQLNSGATIDGEAMIGKSRSMQEVFKAIGRVAPTDATVLIRGESGTGKELVARAIYQHSLRSNRPFLVINCVAIPDTLLESELFGYEKGSFTGATHRKIGKIEQANNGTIFLDEIGDMPINIQAKILRLLQEKSIERLGGRQTIPVDVRIIAATNRDLEEAVSTGNFREDLYYRLNVVTIWLPPLRERREDIILLAQYFLNKVAAELKVPNPGLTEEAKKILTHYNWPGNVRELSNVIRKVLIFNRGAPITEDEISICINDGQKPNTNTLQKGDELLKEWIREMLLSHSHNGLFDLCLDKVASILISEAMTITGGNRSQAANLLGISRPTLNAKIQKYGLKFETSVTSDQNDMTKSFHKNI